MVKAISLKPDKYFLKQRSLRIWPVNEFLCREYLGTNKLSLIKADSFSETLFHPVCELVNPLWKVWLNKTYTSLLNPDLLVSLSPFLLADLSVPAFDPHTNFDCVCQLPLLHSSAHWSIALTNTHGNGLQNYYKIIHK